jgi:4-hydroxy-3-methylbut-2-en-1-yl diphosphate synthase IspG/GcpE
VAIAVMGCIVNGPGEMADADFGYVGGAPGKVDLYVGKEMVKKGIPNEEVRAFVCLVYICVCVCVPLFAYQSSLMVQLYGHERTNQSKPSPNSQATDALVELIKEHGRWVEPSEAVESPDAAAAKEKAMA